MGLCLHGVNEDRWFSLFGRVQYDYDGKYLFSRVQNERMDINYFPSTREYTQLFGINNEILDNLGKKITIMHPGPINRGVEITSDVADSNQSIILNQVENGVAVRMAVIYLLAQQIKR